MDFIHREELQALRPLSLTEVAVLLIGHGSQLSPDSSRPVHDLAHRLSRLGRFAEVRVAFWKEEPQLDNALDTLTRREVFAVPVFMAEGYFTDVVVPRELGLDGSPARSGPRSNPASGQRLIHYCPPVGTSPRMAQLVLDRAADAAPLTDQEKRQTALVLVGHGTRSHPRSGDTTLSLTRQLQEKASYGQVVPAFLDEEPTLGRVLEECEAPNIVVVPFFVSEGWHVGSMVSGKMIGEGLDTPGNARKGPERIRYAAPVGTHPALAGVVVEVVENAASEATSRSSHGFGAIGAEPVALRAKAAFASWVREGRGEPRIFLQTCVSWSDVSGFEIRHSSDAAEPTDRLRSLRLPDDVLKIARTTAEGSYRRLSSSPDLASGWRIPASTEDNLWEAYGSLYPAAIVHWYQGRTEALQLTSFGEFASRQTGIYTALQELGTSEVSALVETTCSSQNCLREPTWWARGQVDPAHSWETASASPDSAVRPGERFANRGGEGPIVGCPGPCAFFAARSLSQVSGGPDRP